MDPVGTVRVHNKTMKITKVAGCLAILIAIPYLLVAGDFRASVSGSKIPPGLSSEMAGMIEKQAIFAEGPDGKVVAEFWPRKVAFSGDPVAGFGIRFETMPEGSLLGVVRFPKNGSDFREQNIKSGIYTMRYGLHPEDGNHMGVAASRDFALLIKTDADTEPSRNLPFDLLTQLSISSSGNPHPTVLRLELPDGDDSGHIWQDETGHWVLDLAIPGDVIGVVVYGHSEE